MTTTKLATVSPSLYKEIMEFFVIGENAARGINTFFWCLKHGDGFNVAMESVTDDLDTIEDVDQFEAALKKARLLPIV